MSNLDNLTSKIVNDAEVKRDAVIKEANQKAEAIVNKKADEANKKAAVILEKAKEESRRIEERLISKAELEVRNKKLATKQQMIDKVFSKAEKSLLEMSPEKFNEFVKTSIESFNLSGDETIMMNETDMSKLSKDFLQGFKLESNNDISGGFIIKKNGIEINCSFDELVNSLRYELEYEVGCLLFNK